MNMGISLTGNKDIDAVLRGLPDQFNHRVMQAAHAEAAKPLVAREHLFAPVGESGRLADSIGVVKMPFAQATAVGQVFVGPRRGRFGGNVGHLVEFGTNKRATAKGANRGIMPKKPFVEPAYNDTKDEVVGRISLALAQKTVAFMKRTIKNG